MRKQPRGRFRIGHALMRRIWTGTFRQKPCAHRDQINWALKPSTDVCADCVKLGDGWIHLRMCMTCGYIGCCDKAKNQHSYKHYQETGHPIMRSLHGNEDWMWCYVDQALLSP